MHVCRFAAGEGYLERPIWEKLPMAESAKPRAEKRTITLEQYREASGLLSERDRLAFDLVMFVGLRESEVFRAASGRRPSGLRSRGQEPLRRRGQRGEDFG